MSAPEFEDIRYEMRCEFCTLHVGWERPIDTSAKYLEAIEESHLEDLWELARQHTDNPDSAHRGEPVVITRTSTITVKPD